MSTDQPSAGIASEMSDEQLACCLDGTMISPMPISLETQRAYRQEASRRLRLTPARPNGGGAMTKKIKQAKADAYKRGFQDGKLAERDSYHP